MWTKFHTRKITVFILQSLRFLISDVKKKYSKLKYGWNVLGIFFFNAGLVCYCLPQIFELCHFSEINLSLCLIKHHTLKMYEVVEM